MRTILFILRKEFLQIFRNKSMLPLIFITPFIQLIVLSNAATFEIKNIRFDVIDFDQTSYSRELISKFTASNYFTYNNSYFSIAQSEEDFETRDARLVLFIPKNFEKDFITTGQTKVQLIINAEDGNAAGVVYNYSSSIVSDFNSSIVTDVSGLKIPQSPMIDVTFRNWFNPLLNYNTFMVPGILVVLVTMIGMFLAGMNIAKEKEMGTIEQLNVTPIKKYQFIIGKLMPFWVIGMAELSVGILVGRVLFNIPFLGSLISVYIVATVYMLSVLGIGLFISTITNTQQQAMFIAWFFMVIFILMGGIFTPIESMPQWAQTLDIANPIAHFNKVMRMIMLKGSHIPDFANTIYFLAGYAVVILSLAVWRYKKVS